MLTFHTKNTRPVEESGDVNKLTNNKKYYKKYLIWLEDFLHKESRTLTTLEYYKIAKEIEKIKEHIEKLK